MKRFSQGGSSPASKFKFLIENDDETSSEEEFPDILRDDSQQSEHRSTDSLSELDDGLQVAPEVRSSQNAASENLNQLNLSQVLPRSSSNPSEFDYELFDDTCLDFGEDSNSSPDEAHFSQIKADFATSLEMYVNAVGTSQATATILENEALKKEIVQSIFSETHKSLKSSLKTSQLTASKKDRNYLLSLNPRSLCEEFQENSSIAFLLVVQGLLGVSNPDEVYDSAVLLNIITLVYSTVGKIINRKASGYGLLLTTAARDGGLREDTIKLFCCCLHPRTSQKYDKEVLGEGWDTELKETLKMEKDHFEKQQLAEMKLEKLFTEHSSDIDIESSKTELETILDTVPPQTQVVWDNLNLRSKHRFKRVGDEYSDSNLDWMASLFIQDRIDANHMENREGVAVKDADNLSIKDMVPSEKELDYVFRALVAYYSHRLVSRHPTLFKSLAGCIRPNVAHHFQEAMDSKSKEFTGQMFTKSECRIEDLIDMMAEVQENVNTFKDANNVEHCHEKKILSGDNKTEKNMHYGILRSET